MFEFCRLIFPFPYSLSLCLFFLLYATFLCCYPAVLLLNEKCGNIEFGSLLWLIHAITMILNPIPHHSSHYYGSLVVIFPFLITGLMLLSPSEQRTVGGCWEIYFLLAACNAIGICNWLLTKEKNV